MKYRFVVAGLLLTPGIHGFDSIAPPKRTVTDGRSKPIRSVAIIGAGIAGLSLAHGLKNSPSLSKIGGCDGLEVTIFDSREDLDYSVGSGVQLNGGLSVLGKINKDVQKAVMDAAVPIGTLSGRHKSWSLEAKEDRLWDIDVMKMFRKAGGKAEEEIIVNDNLLWHGIMRGALQETLMETLPVDGSTMVCFGKNLVDIKSSGGSALCEFSDGTSAGPFDLIVGCDGIKSAVKEYIEKGKISKDASEREGTAAALYSGIRVAYAVKDAEEAEKHMEPRSVKQVFADGAYIFSGTFGNGKERPPCNCLFVTSLDDKFNGPFKRKEFSGATAASENADWSQDERKPVLESRNRMIQQLETNHIPGQDIAQIVQNGDRFFELGVYFHNPLSFSGWSKQVPSTDQSFVVLCGDSAHAMPPFLGQGANQAIQDSYSLAKRIHDFNVAVEAGLFDQTEREEDEEGPLDLKSTLRQYEKIRWRTTTSITAKAAILGYLETGGRDGIYSKFRDVFFRVLSFLRIPQLVLIDSATPKV